MWSCGATSHGNMHPATFHTLAMDPAKKDEIKHVVSGGEEIALRRWKRGFLLYGFGSAMAGFALLWSRLPDRVHDEARHIITSLCPMVVAYFNPYEQITISDYIDDNKTKLARNKLFDLVAVYLSSKCMEGAHKLNAKLGNNGDTQFSLDEKQEVVDSFRGTRMWWKLSTASDAISSSYGKMIHPRHYMLIFHKRHRQLVQDSYLPEILQQGRALTAKNRQRRLYTNHKNHMNMWTHVPWKHPAMFDTLAMDPGKKDELIEDLKMFQKGKEYHSKVGKAWKRGYLLYGPSGTGKSSTISAMANFLGYDVYDLDLTTVRNNTNLRKLFLETAEQSIIVIEDIHAMELEDEHMSTGLQRYGYDREKITLSGLLNFVYGLWSACGGERIIVLTTNHVDKLDPGLIRRGRMDKHIELSYCRFEAFKVLANS
uniref:AAA+ ATPase domain-containing protein n=1 Tax=Oryza glumipatula TaxID=40148 RepID=A0A0E0BSK9_9ORYZ